MEYDNLILGFGKGGKTLAVALAERGQTVALVEKSRAMYGGTCINVGCIPSKSLVNSAAEAALHAEEAFDKKAARYAGAIAEKRRVTAMLRAKNYAKLHDAKGVTVYDGLGRFCSPNEVEVLLVDGGAERLQAKNIYINTGSEPIPLNLPGAQGNPRLYSSETLMEEDRLPKKLVLIGAGYIGMEFASLYTNFGSQVTILQDGEAFLPREDNDVANEIHAILQRRGVRFLLGAKTLRFERGRVVYTRQGKEEALEADAILIATGRRPNTAQLRAELAGVELTPRGAVQVDEHLRSTAPNIWSLGDVNGGPQFTFTSLDDYRILLSQLSGGGYSLASRVNVPYSVFMDTPLGRVGLTEKQALEQNIPIRVLKLPTASIPKAQVLRKTDGFLKAIVHAESGKILGAALLCPEAYELINTLKLAMDMGADAARMRDMIYTHPTMTEAFNELFAM